MSSACARCGNAVAASANFCPACGVPQAAEAAWPGAERMRPTNGCAALDQQGERRQLTVMFCDMVDSTALSEQLDPEELRHVMHTYYEACATEVQRFDGHIARYLGDGLLVYFGYPQAHEDDPARAVRAALAIQAQVPRLNRRIGAHLSGLSAGGIALRIGIHTGLVVSTPGDHAEYDVLGNTVNVAARLQNVARAGSVVISAATRRLVRGLFVLEDLGPQSLKGITEPVAAHRVLQPSGVQTRLQLAAATGLTPLVGRDAELALLVERWAQVEQRCGQVVLLEGEAGMGKSRLVNVLRERLAAERHIWLECGGSPYHENSALFAVIGLVQQGFDLAPEDSVADQLAKLEAGLDAVGLPPAEVVPLLARLLGLPLPNRYTPIALSPEAQRRRTLDAVAEWLIRLADTRPVALLVEDLHWVDPSTLELLTQVLDRIATAPLLALLTFRPSFPQPWAARPHLLHLALSPLTRPQTSAMIARIAAPRALAPELLEQMVAKTDGVPLFIEELTNNVLESEHGAGTDSRTGRAAPLRDLAVPSTLQDSLMARLDRLGATKEIAMVAAVLGREFSFALLAAVSPLDEPALAEGLERLVRAGLLFVRGAPPAASYMFKHSLIQDTAYQSLLKSKRQELHARVARALEERFPERAEIEAEIIARHYEEAGLSERAVAYYQRAGDRATKRSANAEAIRHLSKGIELIRASHDSPQRAQHEAILQVMLGAPLQAVKGFGDPAVEAAYGRARALCQEIGNAPQLFQALFGLTAFYQTRGDLGIAHEIGQQLLALAQQTGDPALLLLGHMTVGNPLYWLGRSPEALEHLNQTIALYDPAQHRALAYAYGQEPGVVARTFAALALWNTGRHEQALRRGEEAVRLARESRHALSLAFALGFAGTLHWFRREPQRVAACAGELIALSTEQNFPLWLGVGLVQHGWARFATGDSGGSDELHRGLAQLATTGAQIGSKQVMGMLAEIYAADGRADDALAILDAAAASRADAFYDAELQRLKGEIILQRDGSAEREAAALFQRAGKIARAQQATSFELRASVSLSRLLGRQGRAREARTLLANVYGRFTEGLETPDLREAATLLASLS